MIAGAPRASDRNRSHAGATGASRSAFARLRTLLDGVGPAEGIEPIALQLGELTTAAPDALLADLGNIADWRRYPPLGGTEALRRSYASWIERQFAFDACEPNGPVAIEPTPGSKQGLSAMTMLAVQNATARDVPPPAVVAPNPYYPTYAAAINAAGAEAIFYSSGAGDIVRDIEAAGGRAKGRVAAIILCNPSNPDGRIIGELDLQRLLDLNRRLGSVLIVDECYIELYTEDKPPSILASLAIRRNDYAAVALHTLSKRSCAPGLRSGFIAGHPGLIEEYAALNRSCGVSLPYPICAAAAALWNDEAHVDETRRTVCRNWRIADRALSWMPGYRRADAGFFLWLPVRGDEEFALSLWREQALTVMPGRYLGHDCETGGNPGANMIRVALVHQPRNMSAALERLARHLRASWSPS